MKNKIKMIKLFFVPLLIISSVQVSAQIDLVVQGVMNPAVIHTGSTGQLTVDVYNAGFTNVNAGCAYVNISVPSAICSIVSVNAATDPVWTISTDNRPDAITLRNTGGIIDPNSPTFYTVVLDILATNQGGPLTIAFQVSLGFPGCGSDASPGNNGATTSITVSNLVPVKLTAFTAEMSDCSALLKWTSQQEINSKEYQLEGSKDGRSFSPVGVVKAAGNSEVVKSYSFIDKMPFDGINFYRLKIIANSGTAEYSDVVTVNNKCNDKSVRIYPNPLVENQQFGVYIKGYTGMLKAELISTSGQLVKTFTQLHNGTNTLTIAGVAQGNYMLRVTEVSTGANETYKVIIIK